jgi:hypothetical protein
MLMCECCSEVLSGSLLEAALALEAPPGGELTLPQLDQLVANLGAELTAQVTSNVTDPDPSDPYVFFVGPPGSGSISQRYGSGSGFFYYHAKISSKTFISTVL